MMRTLLPGLLATAMQVAAAEPPVPSFKAVEVDKQVEIGYGVTVADVNGDRKPDILLADKSTIVWYQNPTWAKHVMAEKLTALDHVCLAAQDLDGDGQCEVAVGAGWNPGDTLNSGAVFYLRAPADRTQKWTPIALPHEPTVHRMRWVQTGEGKFQLVMVPLHGRGNKAATGEGEGVKILAYRAPAEPGQPWPTQVLDQSLHKTHNFDPVQWDGDPAHELLVGSKEGVFLLDVNWATGQSTKVQLGGDESGGAGEVRAGKLAEGGRYVVTVEPMHGHNLVLYTPPAGGAVPGAGRWQRQLLDETLIDGHALACGDLLGIGADQIVVGWRAMNRAGAKVGIKLLTPLDKTGTKWRTTLVDDNTMACEDLVLADLDGDQKLDIIAAGRATKNVKIYLNQRGKGS